MNTFYLLTKFSNFFLKIVSLYLSCSLIQLYDFRQFFILTCFQMLTLKETTTSTTIFTNHAVIYIKYKLRTNIMHVSIEKSAEPMFEKFNFILGNSNSANFVRITRISQHSRVKLLQW